MQFCNFAKKMQNLNAFSLKNSVALDFVFLGGGYIWKEDNWKKLSEKMSMLKKIICLGMVAVAFFSACDGSSDTMSGPDELESSSSAFSSSSSFFQQQTNPVVPPNGSSSSSSLNASSVSYGTLVDSRDGQVYKTVVIGTQTWMAQNLNYKTENSYCYENDASNCTRYGRLYVWDTATTVCPNGWLLPSKAEWETLFSAVGGCQRYSRF